MTISNMLRPNISRELCGISSGMRRIGRQSNSMLPNTEFVGRTELDSHADTCCAGHGWALWQHTGNVTDVSGFHDGMQALANIPIADCITAMTLPTGETVILVLNQSLFFGSALEISLLSTPQLRHHGCTIEDVPKHQDSNSRHAIIAYYRKEEADGDSTTEVELPLNISGQFSGFANRLPTDEEKSTCRWIHLTDPAEWQPHSTELAEKEESYLSSTSQNSQVSGVHESIRAQISATRAIASTHLLPEVEKFSDEDVVYDTMTLPTHRIFGTTTAKSRSPFKKEDIAARFGIGLTTAQRTLDTTLQRIRRESVFSNSDLVRRFKTHHPDYRRPRIRGKFFADALKSGVTSIHGDDYACVFTNDENYSRFYPMQKKSEVGEKLDLFVDEVGIPETLLTDNAPEFVGHNSRFEQRSRYYNISRRFTEPYSPWQNRAEIEVKELKKATRRRIRKTGAHPRLWNYAGIWSSEVRCLTAHPNPRLKGRTPWERVHGDTPDISQYLEFDWYDKCFYLDRGDSAEDNIENNRCGRILGIAHNHGTQMVYFVLAKSGKVVTTSTVKRVPREKEDIPEWTDYENAVREKLGSATILGIPFILPPETATALMDDSDEYTDPVDPEGLAPERDDVTPELLDTYLGATVNMLRGDGTFRGTVVRRKRDVNGNLIGRANDNPLLDTRQYVVKWDDGLEEELMTNIIAEHMIAESDSEGFDRLILDEITEHRKLAIARSTPDTGQPRSRKAQKKTTRGWEFLVTFKDGTTMWTKLVDLMREYPLQVAEYAVANKIDHEPAFTWWVPRALREAKRIIRKVKSKYWSRNYKFGLELPKNIEDCKRIDEANGNTLWIDAVKKELKACEIAFDFLDDDDPLAPGYQEIKCHLVFDIKMGSLQRKARFVAGGHLTDTPTAATYSSVVSRDTVRLMFLIAAMNDLDILAADISNAYLNAKPREKCFFYAGEEFGPRLKGKRVVIVRALYGLKSSAAAFRAHVVETLRSPGAEFENCVADPDAWRRPAIKPDGTPYYEYVLVYVDDLLICSADPTKIKKLFEEAYTLKKNPETGERWEPPTKYLGATIGKWKAVGSSESYWSMSGKEYIAAAVKNVEEYLGKHNMALRKNVRQPLPMDYRPELDTTPELDMSKTRYYQELIGVLRWITECGRIDILHEISLLSRHNCAPREGHLEACFRIFAYLRHNMNKKIVFNPNRLLHDESRFQSVDWSDAYPDAKDEIPPNAPEPRGALAQINCFVDADHAGDKANRRSHTGVIIFVNQAPIVWYSKRQNTVETSTFGSEYVALRIATELIIGLVYKLRMMGVPVEGPANVFVDNESVVKSASRPESTLKKKHNAICYHRVREACAAGQIRIAWEPTEWNLADPLTKVLSSGKRDQLFGYMKSASADT